MKAQNMLWICILLLLLIPSSLLVITPTTQYPEVDNTLKESFAKDLALSLADSSEKENRELGNFENKLATELADQNQLEKEVGLLVVDGENSKYKPKLKYKKEKIVNGDELYDVEFELEKSPVKNVVVRNIKKNGTIKIDNAPKDNKLAEGKLVNRVFKIDPEEAEFENMTFSFVATGTEFYKCAKYNYSTSTCYGEWVKLMDTVPGQEYNVTINATDPGFGDVSPDTGTADGGSVIIRTGGITIAGTYVNTQALDDIYYTIETTGASFNNATMVLGFNVSAITGNVSNQLTQLNGTLAYCHQKRSTSACGSAPPQGTPNTNVLRIYNYSSNTFVPVRIIPTNDGSATSTIYWNITNAGNYDDFVSPLGWINVSYDMAWTTGGNNQYATFHNDYSTLILTYATVDAIAPKVQNLTPRNGSIFNVTDIANITANITDSFGISNVSINLTYPNGTLEVLYPSNLSSIYNYTLELPDDLIGNYTVRWYANDTSGNINDTESSYFTVFDNLNPKVVNLTPKNNTVYEIGGTAKIGVNATDNLNIANVTVNITEPDNNIVQLNLTHTTGDYYNTTYVLPNKNGTYTIRFSANDTNGNVNDTEIVTFYGNDTLTPNVTIITPINDTTYNQSDIVQITVNATDNIEVVNVSALIEYDAINTIEYLENTAGDLWTVNFTNTTHIGDYNITITATDANGNVNNTEKANFTVQDNRAPQVINLTPANNTVYSTATNLSIGANVTDNNQVANVTVNITEPDNNIVQINLTHTTGDYWNTTYMLPEKSGNYTILFIANDTWGNVNATEYIVVVGNHTRAPRVTNLTPHNNSVYDLGSIINIGANVTDNIDTGNVTVNITEPDNNVVQINLTHTTGTYYNTTYTLPQKNGTYTILFSANDTNGNTNSTEYVVIYGNDTLTPNVTITSPVNDTLYNQSDIVQIVVNATDNIGVVNVSALIEYDATSTIEYLANTTGDLWEVSFTNTTYVGDYNVTISASDENGNVNNTEKAKFTVQDNRAPQVINLTPANNTVYSTGDLVSIGANVTDNIAIANVSANITLPDNTLVLVNLTNTEGDYWNTTYTIPEQTGTYTIRFIANDTEGNINSSEYTVFVGNDNKSPNVTIVEPTNGTIYALHEDVTITANVTDNIDINATIINITMPDNSVYSFNMSESTQPFYQYNFTNTSMRGTYTFRILANDSSGNVNNTESGTFVVQDIYTPNVTDLTPANATVFEIGNLIEIGANVTDDAMVANATVNLTLPNGTTELLNLSNLAGEFYNTSYVIPYVLGQYNLTFRVNDSYGNVNDTEKSYFIAVDNHSPNVTILSPVNNSVYNESDNVTIQATVADNIAVENVSALIVFDTTESTVYLTNTGGDNWQTSFTNTSALGTYNVTIIANDTSGNINATEKANFTVRDNTRPNVTDITPSNGSVFNIGSTIEIGANVTDNVEVANVTVNITEPDSSIVQINLSANSGLDFYNTSYLIPNKNGTYTIRFIANDTSGNVNSTEYVIIVGNDSFAPAVNIVSPINDTVYNQSDNVAIIVNVTDATEVQNVTANVEFNVTTAILNLVNIGGDLWRANFTNTSYVGDYNISVEAYDTNGNFNDTEKANFTVRDSRAPKITNVSVTNTTNESTNIKWNTSEPANSSVSYGTTTGLGNTIETSEYVLTRRLAITGLENNTLYYYNVTSCDESGNCNTTGTFNFTTVQPGQDVTAPSTITDLRNVSASTDNITWVWQNPTEYDFETAIVFIDGVNVLNTSQESYTATNLLPGVWYNITVQTVDTSGNVNATVVYNMSRANPILVNISNVSTTNSQNISVNTTLTFINFMGDVVYNNTNESHIYTDIESGYYTILVEPVTSAISEITYENVLVNGSVSEIVTIDDYDENAIIENEYREVFSATSLIQNYSSVTMTMNSTGLDLFYCPSWNGTDCESEEWFKYSDLSQGELYNLSLVNGTVFAESDNPVSILDSRDVNKLKVDSIILNNSGVLNLELNVSRSNVTNIILYNYTANGSNEILLDNAYKENTLGGKLMVNTIRLDPTNINFTDGIYTSVAKGDELFKCTDYNFETETCNGAWESYMNLTPGQEYNVSFNSTDPGFGEASPDTGTADGGSIIPRTVQIATSGSYLNTQALDDIYYSIETNGAGLRNGTMILGFNVSLITDNSSLLVTQLNGTLSYCHQKRLTSACGSAPPQGTPNTNVLRIYNYSDNTWTSVRLIPANDGSATSTIYWNVTGAENYTQFVSPLGWINVSYDMAWTTGGNNQYATFHNDYSDLILTYEELDLQSPSVINLSPANGTQYNVTDIVNITANVTDGFGISNVSINITYPNGTKQTYYPSNETDIYNFSLDLPNDIIGLYNITWYANDTSGNINDSESIYFNVFERITPKVINLTPKNNSVYDTGAVVNIGANVTDNVGVENVTVNITEPDNNIIQINLTHTTGDYYNTTYSLPDKNGTYTITFVANDTSGNVNSSEYVIIVGNDTLTPNVTIKSPINDTQYNQSDIVQITVNATDNINIVNVSALIEYDSTSTTQYLANTTGDLWEANFTNTTHVGNYNITITATDANGNLNDTEKANFTIRDSTTPNVTDIIPKNESIFDIGKTIEIGANVTDNVEVANVTVNITEPDSSIVQINLSANTGLNFYNTTYTIPNKNGTYTITFTANDTNGNVNSTEYVIIVGNDTTPPQITNLTPQNNSIYDTGAIVNIGANVTDNIAVANVTVNITEPDNNIIQINLTHTTGDYYNTTYTLPNKNGTYTITFTANDTNGNVNSSEYVIIVGNDSIAPNVTIKSPVNDTLYNQSDIVQIVVNATDNINVVNVSALIEYDATNTIAYLENTTGDLWTVNFTNTTYIGDYNITISAYDENGNLNNNEKANITVRDSTTPNVTDVVPENGSVFDEGSVIEIGANATDNIQIANVTINITEPDNNIVQINLTANSGLEFYNTSYTIPNKNGTYTIRFIANDTSGNVNDTEYIFIVGNDTQAPKVNNMTPQNNSVYSTGEVVNIGANVTDNIGVANVTVNITEPDNNIVQINLTHTTGNYYNTTYTIPEKNGTYTITFTANDTNGNTNSSEYVIIVGNDTLTPNVSIISPENDTTYNQSDTVQIIVNATDNIEVINVSALIEYDATSTTQYLANTTGDLWEVNFTNTTYVGDYNITISAYDENGNLNDTEKANSTVLDNAAPNVTIIQPTNGSEFVEFSNVSIRARVIDQHSDSLDTVLVNVTLENGSINTLSMVEISTDVYEANFTNTSTPGTYNFTIIANDTYGNVNDTEKGYFNVTLADQQAPIITVLGCVPDPAGINESVICNATITDNTGVVNVYANVTLPNGTTINQTVQNNLDNYYFNTTNTSLLGPYNVSWYADDVIPNNRTSNDSFNVKAASNLTLYINGTTQNFTAPEDSDINITATLTTPPTGYIEIRQNNTLINQGQANLTNTTQYQPGTYNITATYNATNQYNQTQTTLTLTITDQTPPQVRNLTPQNSTIYDTGEVVKIGANVTDNIQIANVTVNITEPDNNIVQINLTHTTGDYYNTTYTIPNKNGTYTITFVANDTSGNVNSSEYVIIVGNDTLTPNVSIISPENDTTYNQSDTVQIIVNATDNIEVVNVSVLINYDATSTTQYLANTTGDLWEVNFTNTTYIGDYNITISAYDENGNLNNNEKANITVRDSTTPNVTDVVPENGSVFDVGSVIEIGANATDNIQIANVTINITEPDNNIVQINLTANSGLDFYNTSYTIPNKNGTYTIRFIANDTSGNVNDTEYIFIVGNDTQTPKVNNITPQNNSVYSTGEVVNIGANVTDNIGVANVTVNITEPGNNIVQINLTHTTGNYYNTTYTIPEKNGTYTITFTANDTNGNTNSSEYVIIVGNDTLTPNVSIENPANDTTYNQSDTVQIIVNATDNIEVINVSALIEYGSTSTIEYLENTTGDLWEINFTNTTYVGNYNVTVSATDVNGNVNDTQKSNFTIQDNKAPQVTNLTPINSTTQVQNTQINISANVTDYFADNVDTVLANITLPNGTKINVTLIELENTQIFSYLYNETFQIGTYPYTIIANDTSGNVNDTEKGTFTIIDVLSPNVTITQPSNGTEYVQNQTVTFSVQVEDQYYDYVDTVYANITLSNGSLNSVMLTEIGNTQVFEGNFTNTSFTGTYNFTIFANDTSGNINDTEKGYFNVTEADILSPLITTLGCVPVNGTIGEEVQCNATITDNSDLDNVSVNVTLPNGTAIFPTISNNLNNYYFNTTNTTLLGRYNITWYANDTSSNNQTANDTYYIKAASNLTLYINGTNANFTAPEDSDINITATLTTPPTGYIEIRQNNTLINQGQANLTNTTQYQPGTYNITATYNATNQYNQTQTTLTLTITDQTPPQISNLTPQNNSVYSTGEVVNIGANATDNIGVANVTVNITEPDNNIVQINLTHTTGNYYNTTYTIPNKNGTYTITFTANDTNGNLNSSEYVIIVGNDTLTPNVSIISPENDTTYNQSDTVQIIVNATDNINIVNVSALIEYDATSTTQYLANTTGDLWTVNFTNTTYIGDYNITISATDENGNLNNTEKANFTIQDNRAPQVINLTPTNNTVYSTGEIVNIGANVTDTNQVANVTINITEPDNNIIQINLTHTTGDYYNTTYTIPNKNGTYTIRFIANDTSGNINSTEYVIIVGNDTTTPQITNLTPENNSVYSTGEIVSIGANVTDNIGVANVTVNITEPDNNIVQINLTHTTGDYYNTTYVLPNKNGTYTITFTANDTNGNTNSSEYVIIVGNDTLTPNVTIISPTNDTQYNQSNTVEIIVNVTDNIEVENVTVVVANNITSSTINLENSTGDLWIGNFTNTSCAGDHNITITATDVNGNVNNTEIGTFTVLDSQTPQIQNLTPANATNYLQGQQVNISANITDLCENNIDTAYATVTQLNGTATNVSLSEINNSQIYSGLFSSTFEPGRYNFTLYVNDTTGNLNDSEGGYFIVNDVLAPNVTNLNPVNQTLRFINQSVIINATVIDPYYDSVDTVIASVVMSNGSTSNITLLEIDNTQIFYGNFTNTSPIGEYNITIIANDTSGNVNATERTTFNVTEGDFISPTITPLGCVPVNGTIGQEVQCNATITDNSIIDTVLANLTLPDGTSANMTVQNSGSNYYFNTTNTTLLGQYNITWYANDTSANNQTANDTYYIKAAINLTLYINGSNQNFTAPENSDINITATLTTPGYIEIRQNGTLINQGQANLTNTTQYQPGTYNITAIYNTTNQYNETQTTLTLTITDQTPPQTNDIIPENASTFSTGTNIQIGANVTDNVAVANVTVNITEPDNNIVQINLSANTGLDFYNTSYTIPNKNGTYTVQFIANDTTGNINDTEYIFIVGNDTLNPNVTIISPTNDTIYNQSDTVEISVNVTDNIGIGNVSALVEYGSTSTIEYLENTTGDLWEVNFTNTTYVGNYNITISAYDENGNLNTNEKVNITVRDSTTPNVTDVVPENGSVFDVGSVIEIGANVTDNIGVENVTVNITEPDNNLVRINLSANNGLEFYNTSYTIPDKNGTYTVRFIANDTSGNINDTEYIFIVGNDTTTPESQLIAPVNGTRYNVTDTVTITANATDNINVTSVIARITQANGTVVDVSMSNSGGDLYEANFSSLDSRGIYNVTIIVTDSSSNENAEATGYFERTAVNIIDIIDSDENSVEFNLTILNQAGNNYDLLIRPINVSVKEIYLSQHNNVSTKSIIRLEDTIEDVHDAIQSYALDLGGINYTDANMTITANGTYLYKCADFNFTNRSCYDYNDYRLVRTDLASGVNYTLTLANITDPGWLETITGPDNISDSYLASTNSDVNYGGLGVMRIGVTNSGEIQRGIIKFNLSEYQLPDGIRVTDAQLKLYYTKNLGKNSDGNKTYTIHRITQSPPKDWNDLEVTWNSINSTDSWTTAGGDYGPATSNTTFNESLLDQNVSFDVTTDVQNYVDTRVNFGWIIKSDDETTTGATRHFISENSPSQDLIPVLEVEYEDNSTPVVGLVSPLNSSATNTTTVTLTCNATNLELSNATLWHNASGTFAENQTNDISGTYSLTNFTISLTEGTYLWNCNVTDTSNNTAFADENYTFIVDVTDPEINSVVLSPNNTGALDPLVPINITINAIDNLSGIDNVIVQYRNLTGGYQNATATLGDGLYSTIIAPTNGTYFYRIFVNDSAGNIVLNEEQNITVEFDYTWVHSPLTFNPEGSFRNTNVTLGTLEINNTGDFNLTFNLTSNYSLTYYNDSSSFVLIPNESREINVTVQTPNATGTSYVSVLIDSLENESEPDFNYVNGTAVVTEGQPFLSAYFLDAPSVLKRGQSYILKTRVKNIGTGYGFNVTLFSTFPDDWQVTLGNVNVTVGDYFDVNEVAGTNYQIFIPENASTGTKTLVVNATGTNESGTKLEDIGSVIGQTISLSVEVPSEAPERPTGGGGTGSSGTGGKSWVKTPPRPKAPNITLEKFEDEEVIETREEVHLVRGDEERFELKVKNVFKESILFDMTASVEGYLAQYLEITPERLNDIKTGEHKSFDVSVASPAYNERGIYNLKFTIKGRAIAKQTYTEDGVEKTINTIKPVTEIRTVKLYIHEADPLIAKEYLENSMEWYEEVKETGYSTRLISSLVEKIKERYDDKDYAEVIRTGERIKDIRDKLFEIISLIEDIEQKITKAKKQGFDVSETQNLLELGKVALEREDYDTALKRLREAQVLNLVELTKTFHFMSWVYENWWLVLLLGAIVFSGGYFAYSRTLIKRINRKIEDLHAREAKIHQLVEANQKLYFEKQKISSNTYHTRMDKFEKEIGAIKSALSKLRVKRAKIIGLKRELQRLKLEDVAVLKEMKNAQKAYYNTKELTRNAYDSLMKAYNLRRAEIEENIYLIELKISKRAKQELKEYIEIKKPINEFWKKYYQYSQAIRHVLLDAREEIFRVLYGRHELIELLPVIPDYDSMRQKLATTVGKQKTPIRIKLQRKIPAKWTEMREVKVRIAGVTYRKIIDEIKIYRRMKSLEKIEKKSIAMKRDKEKLKRLGFKIKK